MPHPLTCTAKNAEEGNTARTTFTSAERECSHSAADTHLLECLQYRIPFIISTIMLLIIVAKNILRTLNQGNCVFNCGLTNFIRETLVKN